MRRKKQRSKVKVAPTPHPGFWGIETTLGRNALFAIPMTATKGAQGSFWNKAKNRPHKIADVKKHVAAPKPFNIRS